MLRKAGAKQTEKGMETLEQLVPEEHLLRWIEKHIEFGFIREKTEHLYSADNGRPAVDPVMMFKMLLVGYLYGVRSERQLVREVEVNVAYRWFLGLGLTEREGKAEGFYYSDHRTVDGKCNIVLDVHVTSAGVHDSVPYLGRLARVEERFAIKPEAAGLDAAYNTPAICKGLLEAGIFGEVAANRKSERGGRILERRKETVERSFADAKTLHCRRWARYRGLAKVQGQALLSAACQNMRKSARVLAKRLGEPSLPPLQPLHGLLSLALNSLLRFFRPHPFALSN